MNRSVSNFLFSLVKHILSFLFSQMHLINRAEPGNFAESTLLFPLRFGTYNDDAALDSNRTVRDYTSKRFHSMHSKILSQGSGWAFPKAPPPLKLIYIHQETWSAALICQADIHFCYACARMAKPASGKHSCFRPNNGYIKPWHRINAIFTYRPVHSQTN